MKGECPNSKPECKYFPGCFSDTDHIYGRARGLGKLARRFTQLPENKRQICRAEHDEINATYVHLPLPDVKTMREALRRHRLGEQAPPPDELSVNNGGTRGDEDGLCVQTTELRVLRDGDEILRLHEGGV